jgi:hypothetical protein
MTVWGHFVVWFCCPLTQSLMRFLFTDFISSSAWRSVKKSYKTTLTKNVLNFFQSRWAAEVINDIDARIHWEISFRRDI